MFLINNPLEQFKADYFFFYSSGLFFDLTFTNYGLTALILVFFLILTINIFGFYYEINFISQTILIQFIALGATLIKDQIGNIGKTLLPLMALDLCTLVNCERDGSTINFKSRSKTSITNLNSLGFRDTPGYLIPKNLKIVSRKFSTKTIPPEKTPNPGFYLKFKQKRDHVLINFVNNKNKEQEKLIVCYIFFLLGVCVFFTRNLETLGLTFFFLLVIFIIFFIVNFFSEKIVKNKNYQIFLGSLAVSYLILSQNFTLVALYLCVGGYVLFKKTYRNYYAESSKNDENKAKKINYLIGYWNDQETILYHLNKEFRRFYYLDKYSLFLFASYIYYIYLQDLDALPETDLWTQTSFTHAHFLLFIIAVFNTLLYFSIRLIIIFYCNPKNMYPTLAATGAFFGTLGTCIGGYLGYRNTVTHNPTTDPLTPYMQQYILGYKAEDKVAIDLAREFQHKIGRNLPLDENYILDEDKAREALRNYQIQLEVDIKKATDAEYALLKSTSLDSELNEEWFKQDQARRDALAKKK